MNGVIVNRSMFLFTVTSSRRSISPFVHYLCYVLSDVTTFTGLLIHLMQFVMTMLEEYAPLYIANEDGFLNQGYFSFLAPFQNNIHIIHNMCQRGRSDLSDFRPKSGSIFDSGARSPMNKNLQRYGLESRVRSRSAQKRNIQISIFLFKRAFLNNVDT